MTWQIGTRKLLNDRSGFTLIELAVTIAVAGIVAAVVVPNYSTYVARSRQADAKIHLSSAYLAEKAFYLETGRYTTCIRDIGVSVGGAGLNYYTVGFDSAYAPSTCGPQGNLPCNGLRTPSTTCAANRTSVLANAKASFLNATVPTDTHLATNAAGVPAGSVNDISSFGFTVRAVGQVSPMRSEYDRWRINEQKQIQNYRTSAGADWGV